MNASADLFGDSRPSPAEMAAAMTDEADQIADGDLRPASHLLAAQAMTLDAMCTQMMRKANANMGEHPHAMERYFKLALKAQAQSRSTLEALIRLHQPREQTVRHIHVGPNGQAVFIENYRGTGNDRFVEQAHATANAGECTALPSQDPLGEPVPVASRSREETLQDARRG